jgi:hypothetical protein
MQNKRHVEYMSVGERGAAQTEIHHRMRGYALSARRIKAIAFFLSNDVARKPGTR